MSVTVQTCPTRLGDDGPPALGLVITCEHGTGALVGPVDGKRSALLRETVGQHARAVGCRCALPTLTNTA